MKFKIRSLCRALLLAPVAFFETGSADNNIVYECVRMCMNQKKMCTCSLLGTLQLAVVASAWEWHPCSAHAEVVDGTIDKSAHVCVKLRLLPRTHGTDIQTSKKSCERLRLTAMFAVFMYFYDVTNDFPLFFEGKEGLGGLLKARS